MLQSIQDQINANRKILLNLPTHCNFSYVWAPESLDYRLACVFEARDDDYRIRDERM